jgi:methyltransferase (TIGR00027 family)
MEDGSSSKTALFVAAYRARASERTPPLINDPWARSLAGDEGMRLAAAYDPVHPPAELYFTLRTAYLDAQIEKLARPSGDATQVVILGAGFDARAARLAAPGRRFFEVDHPKTQEEKRRRVRALEGEGYPADAATYVPCDFEREDFLDRLTAEGFRASEPAVFLWEGVIYYLTEEAARATLRRVAEGAGDRAVIVFDYLEKRVVEGDARGRARPIDEALRDSYRQLGEPLRFGCNNMLPLLFEEGFRHVRLSSFDELCLHYTGTYNRDHFFRFQHMALASRAPVIEP